jgi:nucleotide-binding universal stress UspA family protein
MFKVLIPIDGSEFSESVFESVKKLLSPERYSLTLLEIAPVPEELEEVLQGMPAAWATRVSYKTASAELRRALEPDRSAYVERVWKNSENEVLATMTEAVRNLEQAGFKVEASVRFGEAAQEISDFVAYEQIDMVVMATHGRSGLSRMVMGSVAEKVLRALHVPVMMVRPIQSKETLPVFEIADAMA